MGWFLPSHLDQGAIFGCLGLWHMYNTLHKYVEAPNHFRSSTWFPAHGRLVPSARLRCLELWVLLVIIVVFICKQLSHATADLAAGVIQSQHLQRFQHVIFALFFLVYTIAGLVSEHTALLHLPSGALHCTFALGFLAELVVFHFGHHPGEDLESFIHMLMQIILVFLVLFMLLEIQWPRSVLVSVGRCMLLIFKGTWFAQIGFILNFPSCVPLGCHTSEEDDYPVCPTHESLMRAKALQVLIFNSQLLCILVGTIVAYGILAFQSTRLAPHSPRLPSIVGTPRRGAVTPRTREKEASVYFQVPDEVDDEEDEVVVDAHGSALKSLSRRASNRNAKMQEEQIR